MFYINIYLDPTDVLTSLNKEIAYTHQNTELSGRPHC